MEYFRPTDIGHGDHLESLIVQGQPVNLPAYLAETHHADAYCTHSFTNSSCWCVAASHLEPA